MQTEHRRASRHLLGGTVDVTDLESEKEIVTVASNLSLFGCFVATVTPFLTGTRSDCESHTVVRHSQPLVGWPMPQEGMGIAFGEIEARDRAILDSWLGENEV